MLEEKLEKRRMKKMEKLQQKHENENKVGMAFFHQKGMPLYCTFSMISKP